MASAEESDQQFLHDRFLADDHFAQLGFHLPIAALELFHRCQLMGGQIGRWRFIGQL